MATAVGIPNDIVTFLKAQHRQAKVMLTAVLSSQGDEREQAFAALRDLLTAHESAEKRIVHPTARLALTGGEAIVREIAIEELAASHALIELSALNVGSEAFESKFRTLQANVLVHAAAEETQEFDALRSTIDPKQLASMLREVQASESMVAPPPAPGKQRSNGASAQIEARQPRTH